MKQLYDHREVSRLLGISTSQVRYWATTGLIPPVERRGRALLFDFAGLVSFRSVKGLLDRGVSVRQIRGALRKLGTGSMRGVRVRAREGEVVVGSDGRWFTPEGQFLMDFSKKEGEAPVAEPARVRVRKDSTEALFFRGLELYACGDLDGARRLYLHLLELEPLHTDALVNLGNIEFALGSPERAEYIMRRALRLDPDHVEGNYNLANLLERQGDQVNAVLFYTKAVHEDPDFASAHFDLAEVLEELGCRDEARDHWAEYLRLEPEGEHAEYARARLET